VREQAVPAADAHRVAVLLLDRDGDPVMRLGLYGDDEVVAVWRRLGAEGVAAAGRSCGG
jgi:hypothetical protein